MFRMKSVVNSFKLPNNSPKWQEIVIMIAENFVREYDEFDGFRRILVDVNAGLLNEY